jgi:monooxygenase
MTATEHVDVIIVGAGLSGIGAAAHVARECPDRSVAILESRDTIGGTWDLFRYPGVRSDSDMHTLGYSFRPWAEEKAIADGPSILRYIQETATELDLLRLVRLRHRVLGADWDSDQALWTVRVQRDGDTESHTMTCSFLWSCAGYYRYDEGYAPQFPGVERFAGRVVHPQHWPADLDHAGKRVVVIGSGATAVTLVPAMAGTAEHVTMLQRSPTYILSLPGTDPLARRLRSVLPTRYAHAVVRWKNILAGTAFYQLSRRRPEIVKSLLRKGALRALPAGFDVDTHLTPTYQPWDQRLCLIPDGDLYRALRRGTASIVTDRVETFTENGIRLASGAHVAADIVVTATGLNLLTYGGMSLTVDGVPVDFGETVAYKGMMLSGVPNFFWTVGYTNASWTLKADLVAAYACRVMRHMRENGHASVTPLRPADGATQPLIDLESGYVLRSRDAFPKQGVATPWRLHQNYVRDVRLMRRGPLDDGVRFATVRRRPDPRPESLERTRA